MHVGHLVCAPWLSTELLGAGGTTAPVKVATRQLIEAVVEEQLHHDGRRTVLVLLARAPVHAHGLLLLVLVHAVRLLLLVEAGQELLLLLVHVLEGWLHSILAVAVHLIWPEVVQHTLVHVLLVLLVVEALIYLLIE